MSGSQSPKPGDKIIDASAFTLVDTTPKHIATRTKLRDGAEKALANLGRLTPEYIARAGISEAEIKRLLGLGEEHKELGIHHAASAKLTELLFETRIERGHEIGTGLAELAAQIRRRAERSADGAELLGPIADLLEYQYGPAARASLTKEKKATAAPSKPAPAKPDTKPETTKPETAIKA